MFNATCSGHSWTTTYDAGTKAEYTDVEVRLTCETADEVPFTVFEHGTGKKSETSLRRIVSSPPHVVRPWRGRHSLSIMRLCC